MPRPHLPNCLVCGERLVPDRHTGRGLKRFCSPSCGRIWFNSTPEHEASVKEASLVAAANRSKKAHSNPKRRKKIAGKRVYTHIAEVMLGRHLLPGEVVHHLDGDHTNNHPDNLFVCKSNWEHYYLFHRGR